MTDVAGGAASADLVVKVGGSLARVDAATRVVEVLASARADRRILILSGGGAEADEVRETFRRGELGLVEAHWEAIRSLDRMGARLAARYEAERDTDSLTGSLLTASLRLCASTDACRAAWSEGRLALVAPYLIFDELDPLPHRWDVTSDSVAAWLAEHFAAPELLLVKAREPRSGTGGGSGKAEEEAEEEEEGEGGEEGVEGAKGRGAAGVIPARAAVEEELVDPYFPTVLSRSGFRARCWIVNGQRPERLAAWLETGSTEGLWRVEPPEPAPEDPL